MGKNKCGVCGCEKLVSTYCRKGFILYRCSNCGNGKVVKPGKVKMDEYSSSSDPA